MEVRRVLKFKLKVLLAMRDMTQKQLSDKAAVRQPTISAIANGGIKQFPVDGLNRICAALNCQPGDIMEYVPDANGEQEKNKPLSLRGAAGSGGE
jgi:putative transcriptional regulator